MSDRSLDSLPTAPGENLFGHIHLVRNERFEFMRNLGPIGPLVRVRFLHRTVLFATTAELAQKILVEHAPSTEKASIIRLILHDVAGDGLFTSEGPLWKRQRRLMAPLFHSAQLANYTRMMNAEARRALDRFKDGEEIDLAQEATRIAMGVVGTTLFGADNFNQAEDLAAALTTLLGWINEHIDSPMILVQLALRGALTRLRGRLPGPLDAMRGRAEKLLQDPILVPGRNSAKLQAAMRTLDARIHEMIRERRAHPTSSKDLLARLLLARDLESESSGDGMSDEQVRDEAATLFVAGNETTATAIAWCFYLLARHPEARARVQAEADAFGPDGPMQAEPQALAYTTRVFKEALRLYPPILVLARRTLAPIELAGRTIPAHTNLFVCPYTIHQRPELWPEPERFEPDRFLPEQEASRPKSAWLPFGLGPRVCIGGAFALLEGPLILATLMRRARFEIDPDRMIDPESFTTPRPAGGVPAVVRFR
ncbi:MAG: cytochrome P450 [Polyangia bacterium]